MLTTQAFVQREDADASFYANWELALSGGFAWTFDNPVWNGQYPWTWQVGGGIRRKDYDMADPTIDPTQAERDDTWWARTAIVLPVAETWALVPQIEYYDQSSNYDLRTFDNLTTLVGVQKRF
ncbi:MAG: hypothetical protein GY722_20605 [bacterium]|nr:hypothetical protein [bacterium]